MSFEGQTAIGAIRNQVPKVVYKQEWQTTVDKQSEKLMPKQSGDYGMATQSGEVRFFRTDVNIYHYDCYWHIRS